MMKNSSEDIPYEYDPTEPYVLSKPGKDYEQAIIRVEDDEIMGTDGWQQLGVPEDATFRRDLNWIVPELNRIANNLKELKASIRDALSEQEAGCHQDAEQILENALRGQEV